MSLLTEKNKSEARSKNNITFDAKAYQKEYYHQNRDYVNELVRTRRVKLKYNIDENICKRWGRMTGDVWELVEHYKDILRRHPELKEAMITAFQNDGDVGGEGVVEVKDNSK
jgi:hypothetical protein